jgi:hypothetical protein
MTGLRPLNTEKHQRRITLHQHCTIHVISLIDRSKAMEGPHSGPQTLPQHPWWSHDQSQRSLIHPLPFNRLTGLVARKYGDRNTQMLRAQGMDVESQVRKKTAQGAVRIYLKWSMNVAKGVGRANTCGAAG